MVTLPRNGIIHGGHQHRQHVPHGQLGDDRLNGNSIRRIEVSGSDFVALLDWLHSGVPAERRQNVLTQIRQKARAYPVPPAVEVIDWEGQTVVAAYFSQLPGQVATLGSVRAAAGYAAVAAEALVGMCGELKEHGIDQIQAILPLEDAATPAMLAAANFQRLSTVQHMWLTAIDAAIAPQPPVLLLARRGELRWIDASQIAFRRLAKLVDETFEATLDCPALNGLRSQRQVLEGFLEGVPLRSIRHWEVLELEGELVGLLFLKQHEQQTIELGYMGIVPHQRGWGLGHALLNRFIELCQRLRARQAVVAVDTNNAPAVQLYLRYGFLPDSQCSVWLHQAGSRP